MNKRHLISDPGLSYIVRIYRRGPADEPGQRSHDALELIGTVEDAQAGGRYGFHNIEELWAVLSGVTPAPDSQQRNKDRG